jgi:prephenate dehydrogenase|tara:strand:+ start:51 stop:905 length:855 start_codon:yes stop_codon:yes gene_type:complete
MKIGIIGIGLMGGSFALDFRSKNKNSKIYGLDSNKKNLEYSIKNKIVDELLSDENCRNLDFLIISVPVHNISNIVKKYLNSISKNTLVIDLGSTKKSICESLKNHPKRDQFLATHPIAGTENSGPRSIVSGLYFNSINIICESHKTRLDLLEKALKLFKSFKMKIIKMDPSEHDKNIAYLSHLSHISSFMLAKTILGKKLLKKNIFDLAGSGFESTVRLAKSSPETWTSIFNDNKSNITEALNEYIDNLKDIMSLIESNQKDILFDDLNKINLIREILSGIKTK